MPVTFATRLLAERDTLQLDESGGKLWWDHTALPKDKANKWLEDLLNCGLWKQGQVRVYAKWHNERRLTFAVGDGHIYYSGRTVDAVPWDVVPAMVEMKEHIERLTGDKFDTALLNLYRSGGDVIGWHSDDEGVYSRGSAIASVSLGASRDFAICPKKSAYRPVVTKGHNIPLRHGTLLVMGGSMQEHWKHSVPERKKCTEPRVNITFRRLRPALLDPTASSRARSRTPLRSHSDTDIVDLS